MSQSELHQSHAEEVVPNRGAGATRGGERLRVVQVPISRLRPWPGNPRVMPEAELAKLCQSIQTFGLVEPLVVRRSDQVVVGGHQRLLAAKHLGYTHVPVVYVDVTEVEAKALNLALNRISGSWDLPRLGALLDELQSLPDFDVALTGFDLPEIGDLLADLARKGAPSPREPSFPQAAEALQEWAGRAPTRVAVGDLWQLDRHRLLCEDSLAPGQLGRLLGNQPVDMVLTDPPYGIDFASTQARPGRRKKPIANDGAADFEAFFERALPAIKAHMKKGSVLYSFAAGGGPSSALAKVLLVIERHFALQNTLIWDRVDMGLGWRWRRTWEAIIEASVGKPRVWHGGRERRNLLAYPHAIPQAGDHPTPKPIPLLEDLLRSAAPVRGRVLDPFSGSGSTLIAAARTGRVCFALELEPHYCDITLARWEALTGLSAVRMEGKETN